MSVDDDTDIFVHTRDLYIHPKNGILMFSDDENPLKNSSFFCVESFENFFVCASELCYDSNLQKRIQLKN
jgi:hypothetical protein